jgi:DNA adenine methylase
VNPNQNTPDETAVSTLKWVGGKRRISQQIITFFPPKFGKYYEPFFGGGSVFFKAQPKKSHLTDLNASLINYYIQLRDNTQGLMRQALALQKTFTSMSTQDERKSFYYEVREKFNRDSDKSSLKNAVQFLFLNKTSFNGIYRENSKGEFNVPFNNTKKLNLFQPEQLEASSRALQGATMEIADFREAVSKAKTGDLVYFDPPYVPLSSTASFTDYTKSDFGPESQEALRDLALKLRAKGVFVVLSNSFSPVVKELYGDFQLHQLQINRLVAADKGSRGQISEYLIVGQP